MTDRVLRPRRSVRRSDEAASRPRRSTRLGGSRAAVRLSEEPEVSDVEPVPSQVMEGDEAASSHSEDEPAEATNPTDPEVSDVEPEPSQEMEGDEATSSHSEDEPAELTNLVGLRSCTVVLDRLTQEEETAQQGLGEIEDMIRKSEKQRTSRIPTFQSTAAKKRPTGGSHNAEVPLSKKDARVVLDPPSQTTLLPQKVTSGVGELSKSKLPGVRETAFPPPARPMVKKVPETAPSGVSPVGLDRPEQAAQGQHMVVSSRPALRAVLGDHSSEEEQPSSSPNDPKAHLNSGPGDAEGKKEDEAKSRIFPTAPGVTNVWKYEELEPMEPGLASAIADKEPPQEAEPTKLTLELEDNSKSPSNAQHAKAVEPFDDGIVSQLGQRNGNPNQHAGHGNIPMTSVNPNSTTRLEESTHSNKATSRAVSRRLPTQTRRQPTKQRPGCGGFTLFGLLSTTLLLLGGFGHHVWHYGLPKSMAHLTAQLELHWLEGLGLVEEPCGSDCRVRLVESIPVGLYPYDPSPLPNISDSWLQLLHQANTSVQIAAFYLTLRDKDTPGQSKPIDAQGRKVFQQLMGLELNDVNLQIAVSALQSSPEDTSDLAATGAEVREVDLQSVTGGVVHTKLWVVDQEHFYLGSANVDWRSLTQVKEVGLVVENCSCLARDASRIFGVYWSIGAEKTGALPPYWPARLSALSSSQQPLSLHFNGVPAQVYLSSAPPQISTRGRTDDLSAILSVIRDAQRSIHISVMDYLPLSEFTEPLRFFAAIDTALREAACTRGVEVKLLVSCWQHSPRSMFVFLQSLLVLRRRPLQCDISVKVFRVLSTAEQQKIPFARVNHAKYMVTDRVVYIGTSNWSENYFTQTAGVGLVVNQTGSAVGQGRETLQSQAERLFRRDWTSQYASTLTTDDAHLCTLQR